MYFISSKKRGFTLTEVILAISVSMTMLVGGFIMFQQASTSTSAAEAGRDLMSVATEARNIYVSSGSFSGATTESLIAARAIRPGMVYVENGELYVGVAGDGRISYETQGTRDQNIQATVTFGSADRRSRIMCNRLTASNDQSGVGPLGNGYLVTSSSCNDNENIGFVVLYSQDGGIPLP